MTPLKKLTLIAALFALIGIFGGCAKSKTCTPNAPSTESLTILNYASANGMNVTAHSSGLYYEILSQGSGPAVTINSKIKITYVGELLDGTEFDRQDSPNTTPWLLGGLIEGWQIGVPLIQKGGRIRLIVPSALGYGCQPYGPLPGNSILYFDITLVDVD